MAAMFACCAIVASILIMSCNQKDELVNKDVALKACGTCGAWPYCCNATTGDWGWENNKSCITKCSAAAVQQCNGGCSGSSSGSCPSSLSCPSGISCGCYTVNGLGSTKTGLKNVGGSRYWLASCMMETESMTTNYTYGDGKSGDSFNAGRAKQNFGAAKGAGVGQGSTGNFWNYCTNANNDKNVWNAIKSHYGSNYWAVHRGGPDWPRFKAANDWTDSQLNGHEYDNVRFWCSIPSI